MICYNCGTKLESDENVCPACGKRQAIPESLLVGAKKGDRSSIVGLYNYSYASVFETVEAYISDDDAIQDMIKDIYLEAFRKIFDVKSAGEFRSFLHGIALEKIGNRQPLEKEPSPGWLIIPDTQTMRQVLDGTSEFLQEQAHRYAERELIRKYAKKESENKKDDNSVIGDWKEEWESAEKESQNVQEVDGNTSEISESVQKGPERTQITGESVQKEPERTQITGESVQKEPERTQITGESTQEENESIQEELERALKDHPGMQPKGRDAQGPNSGANEDDEWGMLASSANEDWSSLQFNNTPVEEEEQSWEVPASRAPLILGVLLALLAVAIVAIIAVGAFGGGSEPESESRYAASSESESQSLAYIETETDMVTESESASETEDLTETETVTEEETQEASEIEIDPTGNILMSDDIPLDEEDGAVFGNDDLLRSEIGSVTFLNTLEDAPDDAWDVSENGDGLVMAWAVLDETDDLYDLYLAGEGGIYSGENCAYMFALYVSAVSIDFNGYFFTENATDMSGMFYECASLERVDMSGIDTSEVTNLSYMFYDCLALTELDLSSFETSSVTAMSYMFTACESLEELSIDVFDFSNVTDMEYMFAGCSSLESLDVDLTDVAEDANTEGIYEGAVLLD